jgi:hypothetical protein
MMDPVSVITHDITTFWPYLVAVVIALLVWGATKAAASRASAYWGWGGFAVVVMLLGAVLWWAGISPVGPLLLVAGVLVLVLVIVVR